MMRVPVEELSLGFSTRPAGGEAARVLLERVRAAPQPTEPVELDFTAVRFASFSFIDELVAPFIDDPALDRRLVVSATPTVRRAIDRSRRIRSQAPA